MHRWSWHRPKARLRRRLTVTAMLGAYLVTAIGIPVPVRVHKPGHEPFPCQHHACGCATAEQCRNDCCCYTASQRLAWAQQRGVTLAASVVAQAAAEAEKADLDCQVAQAAPGSCCAHHEAEAAGDNDLAHQHREAGGCCEPDEPYSQTRRIFSFTRSKCRAVSSLWCATGAVVLPPLVSWQFQWDVIERVSPLMASLDFPELAPPVPPPRV